VGCCSSWRKRGSLPKAEFWRPKLRTAAAMAYLCQARLLVAWVPFDRWQDQLGFAAVQSDRTAHSWKARRLAADVDWAAKRLPFPTACLPRAMALSWMLRRKRIEHSVVFAVRPADSRESAEAPHAWVEIDGQKILGDLSGPWIETLRLGA